MSHVTCHLSPVTCHMSKYIYIFYPLKVRQIGWASRGKVCYQRGLPSSISVSKNLSKTRKLFHDNRVCEQPIVVLSTKIFRIYHEHKLDNCRRKKSIFFWLTINKKHTGGFRNTLEALKHIWGFRKTLEALEKEYRQCEIIMSKSHEKKERMKIKEKDLILKQLLKF